MARHGVLSEQDALEVVDAFLKDIRSIDGVNPQALFLVGSLGGRYYRPGQSDIDTILVLDSNAVDTWGTFDKTSPVINSIRERYRAQFGIPKGFGAVAIREKHLYPPYPVSDDPSDVFVYEVARLKTQGRLYFGQYDLGGVPLPSKRDLLSTTLRFDRWFSEEFLNRRPLSTLALTESINCLVGTIQGLLLVERDILEFNKFSLMQKAIDMYSSPSETSLYQSILRYLHGENERPNATRIAMKMDQLRDRRNEKIRQFLSGSNAP